MCSCFVCNMPVEIFPMKNWERFDPVKSVKIFGIFSDSIPKPWKFWLKILYGQCASLTCSELACQVVKGLEYSLEIHCSWKKTQHLFRLFPVTQMCWDMFCNLITVPDHIIMFSQGGLWFWKVPQAYTNHLNMGRDYYMCCLGKWL